MTLHKLNPESQTQGVRPFEAGVSVEVDEWSIAQAIVKARALQTFSSGAIRFPLHRQINCAARGSLRSLFDDLTLGTGLSAQRFDVGRLLLDGPGVFVYAHGAKKSGYCSCSAEIWAEDQAR